MLKKEKKKEEKGNMAKSKNKKWKNLVEIKTNTCGWRTVELIKVLSNNRVLLKLSSGELISRKRKHMRLGTRKKVLKVPQLQ